MATSKADFEHFRHHGLDLFTNTELFEPIEIAKKRTVEDLGQEEFEVRADETSQALSFLLQQLKNNPDRCYASMYTHMSFSYMGSRIANMHDQLKVSHGMVSVRGEYTIYCTCGSNCKPRQDETWPAYWIAISYVGASEACDIPTCPREDKHLPQGDPEEDVLIPLWMPRKQRKTWTKPNPERAAPKKGRKKNKRR